MVPFNNVGPLIRLLFSRAVQNSQLNFISDTQVYCQLELWKKQIFDTQGNRNIPYLNLYSASFRKKCAYVTWRNKRAKRPPIWRAFLCSTILETDARKPYLMISVLALSVLFFIDSHAINPLESFLKQPMF